MKKNILISIALIICLTSCTSLVEEKYGNNLCGSIWKNETTGEYLKFTNEELSDGFDRGYKIEGIIDASRYYPNSKESFSKGNVYFTYNTNEYDEGKYYIYCIYQYSNNMRIFQYEGLKFKIIGDTLYINYNYNKYEDGFYICKRIK